MLLALVTFTFSLAGTFLVRSGVLTSVHAFALDPERGVFVLLLMAAISGGGFLLFGLRAQRLESAGGFAPVSRESLLALNNVFLFSAAASVFLGTLYPLILQLCGGDSISAGPPYFEATFTPLMMPLALLMGFAPFTRSGEDTIGRIWPQLRVIFYVSAALALVAFFTVDGKAFRFYLGIFFAVWILATSIAGFIKKQAPLPMALAHAGLAVALIGMVGASHLSSEEIALLKPGGAMQLAGRTLHFDSIDRVKGPNYQADRANFSVSGKDGAIAALHPERRYYDVEKKMTSEVAIYWNGISNLYLVLGEPLREHGKLKGWSVRAALHPLQALLWLGCLIMAVGGLSRLLQRQEAGGKRQEEDARWPLA
jgi:cytochrome c-type biogenesis protein CcmF